jgi:hypothetical protein
MAEFYLMRKKFRYFLDYFLNFANFWSKFLAEKKLRTFGLLKIKFGKFEFRKMCWQIFSLFIKALKEVGLKFKKFR